MANNYTKILELANKNNMGFSNTIKRDYGIPLDYSSVQETYEKAVIYAATSTLAYVGQPIAVGGTLYIIDSVADEVKFVASDEKEYDNYLKEVGKKPEGDNASIVVDEEGKISINGFALAQDDYVPSIKVTRNAEGVELSREIEWVPVTDLVEDDRDTITKIEIAKDSALTISSKTVDSTTTYTLDVVLPAIPEYTVTKTDDATTKTVTYKVTKDGTAVGEAIVVPYAYDDKEVTDDIGELDERLAAVEGIVEGGQKGAVNDHEERLERIEAFFGTADHDGTDNTPAENLNDALDTLVEIQNFLNGEGGAVDNMLGSIAANTAAIGKASSPAVGEEGSEDYQPAVQATGLHKAIEDLEKTLAKDGDFEKRVAAIEEDVSEVDGRVSDLECISKSYLVKGEDGKVVEDAIKKDVDEAQRTADAAVEAIGTASAEGKEATGAYVAIEAAQKAANDAQADVDALEKVVVGEDGKSGVKKVADDAAESASDAHGRLDVVDDILDGYTGKDGDTVKADVDAAQKTANDAVAAIGTASTPAKGVEGEAGYEPAKAATGAYVAIEAAQKTADDVKAEVADQTTGLVATKKIADAAAEEASGNSGRLDDIEADYVRVAKKTATDEFPSLFCGKDGAAVLVFNCGTATTNV